MASKNTRSVLKLIVTILVSIAFILTILFVGLIISQFLRSNEFSFQSILVAVLFIGLSVCIAKQTHLLGHFIAGSILHYRLISYKFQVICMIPLEKKYMLHSSAIWYYASGILCNLFCGILTLCLLLFLPMSLPSLLVLFLVTLSLTWILSGALQSISYFSEGVPTDGKVLWGLLFHTDFSNYYVNNTILFQALQMGMRPAQLPLQSYQEDREIQSADAVFLLYLYYKALDLQKPAVLLKYSNLLEENFSLIPQHLQSAVICELCYTHALKGQAEIAKSYFSLMREFPAEDRTLSYYRACAYYYFYGKGNPKQALSAISYGLETISSCPFSGMLELEQNLLQTLLQEIREIL